LFLARKKASACHGVETIPCMRAAAHVNRHDLGTGGKKNEECMRRGSNGTPVDLGCTLREFLRRSAL